MNKIKEKNLKNTKVRKGDEVVITKGKDRGRKGKIIKVIKKEDRVLVEGINFKKKRLKPKVSGKKGETVEIPAPISISNVKIVCSKCGKPTRIGKKIVAGKKQRICKKCKQDI